MKSLHRHLLTAGLLAGLGLAAVAQTQTQPATPAGATAPNAMHHEHGAMDPARMEQMRARREERMARRLDELKQKLQISRGQEGAWEGWTAALKPTPHQHQDHAAFAQLTTPERIDRMKALRAQRNAQMDKRLDATKTFYAQLTPEQQKTFDQEGMRFFGRMGGKGGHFGHHGRG